jgi:hypothetical protein
MAAAAQARGLIPASLDAFGSRKQRDRRKPPISRGRDGALRSLYYRAFEHHKIRRLVPQRTKAARRSTEQRHYDADEPTTTAATAATKVQQALGSTSSHEPKLRHDLDTAYSQSQQDINSCALRESNPCFRRERAMSWTARRRARRPRRRRGRGRDIWRGL